jgi:hypothetical protein
MLPEPNGSERRKIMRASDARAAVTGPAFVRLAPPTLVRSFASALALAAATTVAGCHCGNKDTCDPARGDEDCSGGQVCELVTDGDPMCFDPVVVAGIVYDTADGSPIEGALVVALDANGAPVTDVAVSDVAGAYRLGVPTERDADGNLTGGNVTLRASADGYQTFPGGIRTALPIDLATAVATDGELVVMNTATDIGLIAVPGGGGLASISGNVAAGTGVLVVAELVGGGAGLSAVSDRDGDYTIFNVPDGDYQVRGYAADVQLVPADVTVAGADLTGVDLAVADTPLTTINGSVQIVNAPGGSTTSVVLVVASTFSATFARGEVPPGLRAPRTGPPDVSGAFTITGVPDGSYAVLAAFENDGLVRDPDPAIAGTQIVFVDLPDPAGAVIDLADSFKVTEALVVLGPGVDAPEAVDAAPTLSWVDDSSEDFYELRVYDALGSEVWFQMVPGASGTDLAIPYGGPLDPGMFYQFRATSFRTPGGVPGPISTTEDLRGVFFLPAP